ncbi:MAG TPA: hypothetical protein VNG12_14420 [Acidimicrobiales bacterium]|nr:hypothetical protein [Acidimicrobiales bacterium]
MLPEGAVHGVTELSVIVVPLGPWVGVIEKVAVGEDAPELTKPSGPMTMSVRAATINMVSLFNPNRRL